MCFGCLVATLLAAFTDLGNKVFSPHWLNKDKNIFSGKTWKNHLRETRSSNSEWGQNKSTGRISQSLHLISKLIDSKNILRERERGKLKILNNEILKLQC